MIRLREDERTRRREEEITTLGSVRDHVARRLVHVAGDGALDEARELVADVLDVPRSRPSTHASDVLSAEQRARIDDATERRAAGMPMAYAVRRAAFRALSLYVDERVLIPRPETEGLVDLALEATGGGRGALAIDVGTGSGAIAIALASEGAFGRVVGTDISATAIEVARLNAAGMSRSRKGVAALEFRCGSFLAPCAGLRADLIVSNPPYIAWEEARDLPATVRDWEPAMALFADGDGLAGIVAVARESARVLGPGGVLAMEVDARRAGRAAEVVKGVGAYDDVVIRPDLTGRARYVIARRVEE